MIYKPSLLVLALTCCTLALTACGGDAEPTAATPPLRAPRPTFTATPLQPTAPPAPVAPTSGAEPAQPAAVADASAIAVVNDELVNIRNAPNLISDIVQVATRGTEFTVVGRSADDEWWQLCCVNGAEVWVYESYVDTSGPVDAVPVREQVAAAPPTTAPTPAPPTAAPEQPTAPPAAPVPPTDTPLPTDTPQPALPFALAGQEQFPESNNLLRIFTYVTAGEQPAPGYTLKVTHDGAEMPVTGVTSAASSLTWPVANPRQRFHNLKVEFPGVQTAGTWIVQLVDGGGNPAGAPATFTLTATDTNRELYVRYDQP